jgi:hypothetical protein
MASENTSGLSRKQISQLYRPVGPKYVTTVSATTMGSAAQQVQTVGNFDLSLPIKGFRLVFKGRHVIGTADMTSTNPEGFLNMITNIVVQGTNSRQKGNVTLWNIDLATLWMVQAMFNGRANQFMGAGTTAGVEVPLPTTPITGSSVQNYAGKAQGTYDFEIVVDLPSYPFECADLFKAGYLIRQEEWADSLTMALTFGYQAGNGTANLGVSAATTTNTFTAYGSGSGSPTVDIYTLPVEMGLDLKDAVLPGFLTRVGQPITTVLQSAGGLNTLLLNLQKQPTARVFLKVGTSTVAPSFATLSDTNVSTLGILLGGQRVVRANVDVFAHKNTICEEYPSNPGPIQGYNCLDFLQAQNPDSVYPGDKVGEGATFGLYGTVAGVANAYGIVLQEQALYLPTGPLYSF